MKNNKCFVDTSALIALNDDRDQYHAISRDIAGTLKNAEFVISDTIINETYNILRYQIGFHQASSFLKKILDSSSFKVLNITPSVRTDTLKLLEQYHDQKISYCDALSVVLMKEKQIPKIFAFDHHFEIMGVAVVRL